jgi:NAD(P)-dependent dehydrogenase (short-subunit alcohol dehydrogenase family)
MSSLADASQIGKSPGEIQMTGNRVSGKIAIVTGGARGIGRATALRLAEEGASVVILDVQPDAGALIAEIEALGARGQYIRTDLTKEREVAYAVEKTVADYSRIDILVNNAGIPGVNKYTHEVSEDEWDAVFNVNVKGTFFMSKHVLKVMMAQRGGAIVNFSSIYGLIGNKDIPPYHATKGAILMMTKTDAICYAEYGIRINAVHPGSTKTELFLQAAETFPDGKEAYFAMMKAQHPLTLGETRDVANCVLFLASDEARFVTGTSLVCDGGYTAQ